MRKEAGVSALRETPSEQSRVTSFSPSDAKEMKGSVSWDILTDAEPARVSPELPFIVMDLMEPSP